ncbi:thioesterase [Sphingobium sp. 22B]|uniref:acyl-CoA thioesterase n=1 Tax=unclassified Sphingobium TaxID=2611147 RepID=UPI0007852759|nr:MULTISPECIES: thioesterase family protein [unclassified Sphingobium]KXU32696.1 thioesterase [Sphingobium sp. AM]KYC32774.1 thioesterase [Sphingobium sp. 22B]OAP31664.1 thioesterase [Sphingobium sp. 20006FA]
MSRPPLSPRSAYRHWADLSTRWADNDLYGHVNNTIHYQWFDTVVNDWLISQGMLDLKGPGPIGLVVESGCIYAAPLSYPQPVQVGLKAAALGMSSVTYQLGIFATGSDIAAAQGRFVHVYVDRDSRRPRPLSPEWRDRFSTLS